MKILITGGAGFIGGHIAEYYAEKDHDIVLFDNMSRTQYMPKSGKAYDYNWEHLNKLENITRLPGDVRDFESLEQAAEGADIIFNAAAQTDIKSAIADPVDDLSTNTLGAFNVLEIARGSAKKPVVIHFSTSKIYGVNVNKLDAISKDGVNNFDSPYEKGIPEDFNIDGHGRTPFGLSKLAADLYMQEYAHLYGLRVGVFRLSTIYGPRQFGIEEQSWPAKMILDVLLGRPLTIEGEGDITRDLLYVKDMVKAVDAFIESDFYQGVFNLGGGAGNLITPLKFVDLIAEKTGKKLKPHFIDAMPYEQKVFYTDISKVRKKLHWSPETSISEGVDEIIKWVDENEILFK